MRFNDYVAIQLTEVLRRSNRLWQRKLGVFFREESGPGGG